MIFDAAHKQRLHVLLAGDAAEVRPDPLLDLPVNPGFAIFGAEDDVVVQGCEGVGHARTIVAIIEKDEWEIVSRTSGAFESRQRERTASLA